MRVTLIRTHSCQGCYVPGIYAVRNLTNGKCYVGSSKNIGKRYSAHIRHLEANTHHSKYFQNSFNVHGKENFGLVVLERVKDVAKLIEREQHWMDKLQPEYNGCKVAITGNRELTDAQFAHIQALGRSFKGTKRSSETIARMKAAKAGVVVPHEQCVNASKAAAAKATGRARDPEIVEKIAAKLRGRSRPDSKGKPRSEEVRRKISEGHLAFHRNGGHSLKWCVLTCAVETLEAL